MSIVYITNANLNQIVKTLRNKTIISVDEMKINIAKDNILDDLISEVTLNDFFNHAELKDIYMHKKILENFSQFLEVMENNKNSITKYVNGQNERYKKNIKNPAYHIDNSCEWMKKNFKNIDKTTGKEVIIQNSGTDKFDNQTIQIEWKHELKKQYTQLRFLFDAKLGRELSKYIYAPSYKIDYILSTEKDIEIHKPIQEFHSAKKILTSLIINFYRNKYNKELSFSKELLESIGFRECTVCESNRKIIFNENYHNLAS